MTWRRVSILIGYGAAIGFTVFGIMVARVTHVERAERDVAEARFLAVGDSLALGPPIFVDDHGELVRRPPPDQPPKIRPRTLRILAYRGQQKGLASSAIPFWFLRLKMPALRFALRETGVDLERFALGPEELARYGPSVVFEEHDPSGDRVLIWTE